MHKGVAMNKIPTLLSEVNEFLVAHTVDKETIEFLIGLKRKLLELEELEVPARQKKKELPQIEILLRTLGKKCFVSCYDIFKKAANDEIVDITSSIKYCSGAKEDSTRRTKASVGTRIFREGLQLEALKSIVAAKKVEKSTREEAIKILQQEEEA